MGAEAFHGRVRDGIGCGSLARATRPPDGNRVDVLVCSVTDLMRRVMEDLGLVAHLTGLWGWRERGIGCVGVCDERVRFGAARGVPC